MWMNRGSGSDKFLRDGDDDCSLGKGCSGNMYSSASIDR